MISTLIPFTFILDDDPTGTQAVSGVSVLGAWDEKLLMEELDGPAPAAFVLANTRALPEAEAVARMRQIARNLRSASTHTFQGCVVVSRSDSTLRGHFPAEVEAFAQEWGVPDWPILLCPFFAAGGRITKGDVHYLVENGVETPVGETEFARDRTFGYRSSNLRDWVAEKTGGKRETTSVSLDDLRAGRAVEILDALPPRIVCILNCETMDDLALLVEAVRACGRKNRYFLMRTAASFAAAYAGVEGRTWEPSPAQRGPGLVVVGSYVARSAEQRARLLEVEGTTPVPLDVDTLLDDRRADTLARAAAATDAALADGRTPVVFTGPAHARAGELDIAAQVSSALVALVRSVTERPRWVVSKGGITSNDIATQALGIRRALILGQLLPGVPVWECGRETLWPGIPLVIFPGNVGGPDALADAVRRLG